MYQCGSLLDGLAVYLSCDTKKFHDNESTHILHNFWTSAHRGEASPPPPGGATVTNCCHDACVNDLVGRRRVLLTTRSTCRGEIFKSGVSGKIPEDSIPLFLRVVEFLYSTVYRIGRVKFQCRKRARFVEAFR